MSPGLTGILVDLQDFAINRLLPGALIVTGLVLLYRWWRRGSR